MALFVLNSGSWVGYQAGLGSEKPTPCLVFKSVGLGLDNSYAEPREVKIRRVPGPFSNTCNSFYTCSELNLNPSRDWLLNGGGWAVGKRKSAGDEHWKNLVVLLLEISSCHNL